MPQVTASTFAEAEKLARVQYTPAERAQAASTWRVSMAPLQEQRTGPRKLVLVLELAPGSRWDPVLPGVQPGPSRNRFVRSKAAAPPLPSREEDIAFAPVTTLARWIESRALTSVRLTGLYLERLRRLDTKLQCVITLTPELALDQARRADQELAKGRYRGPLHGIPWGAKDLVGTAGIPTTYGAESFRDRIPRTDAVVVDRLHRAGEEFLQANRSSGTIGAEKAMSAVCEWRSGRRALGTAQVRNGMMSTPSPGKMVMCGWSRKRRAASSAVSAWTMT